MATKSLDERLDEISTLVKDARSNRARSMTKAEWYTLLGSIERQAKKAKLAIASEESE